MGEALQALAGGCVTPEGRIHQQCPVGAGAAAYFLTASQDIDDYLEIYVELTQKDKIKESKPRLELGKAGKAEVSISVISTS